MSAPEPFQHLEVLPTTPPMEARLVDQVPEGGGWQYEPKWDGFRTLVFRDGEDVALMSKSGKPLQRYFPEVAAALREVSEERFVVDGEIVLPVGDTLSFAALQARLHPAASRIEKLSRQTPAQLMLFDCLQVGKRAMIEQPLEQRRAQLETFGESLPTGLLISPCTHSPAVAREWLARTGGALDGIVAKRLDEAYQPGERAMFKHKIRRTADCVVGGFRLDRAGNAVASLLLGLHDDAGLLNYVGYTSSFSQDEREGLLDVLEPLKGESGFTGSAPGGASRWSKSGRSNDWTPVAPTRIAEVIYDQVTGDRFRHGTTFCRWRPDKDPAQCTMEQFAAELRPDQLEAILKVQPA